MASEKARDTRARNFARVVYPESAPENWKELLAEKFVPAFISPLHDQDVNPGGEPKKPHYHVMVMHEGKKSKDQVKELFDSFGGVGCETIQSIRGYARYLCHLDNPEKHQYSPSDVTALCGADYQGTIGLVLDKYKAVREMLAFCQKNGIQSYAELLLYASVEQDTWFRVLCDSGTVVMKEYLKSATWTAAQTGLPVSMPKSDPETGEVVED